MVISPDEWIVESGFGDGKAGVNTMAGPPKRHAVVGAATILAGLLTLAAFTYEAIRDRGARRIVAIAVERSIGLKGGTTLTEVEFLSEGRPARATLRAWILRFEQGDAIPIVAPPGRPDEVRPDGLWPTHFLSFASLCALTIAAIVDLLSIPIRRQAAQREAFLIDAT